jgi:SAM-dependent methyltransferase
MTDSVHRFDQRVEDYIRWRPDYPDDAIDHVCSVLNLASGSTLADIGSGTGKLSRPFLERGVDIIGVEPNLPMKQAGDLLLEDWKGFSSVQGTAEKTGLPDGSVDGIIAGQAFHWFEPEGCKKEWTRILKVDTGVALIWNSRPLTGTPFMEAYESFLQEWGTDYDAVSEQYEKSADLRLVLGESYQTRSFDNGQELSLEGLKGRICSCSYVPDKGSADREKMVAAIPELFRKHEENGQVNLLYDANVYW